jgi:hypothetical protein
MKEVVLSPLPHTWLVDVDGTIVRHNGHKGHGDELLPGVKALWDKFAVSDVVVLLSARTAQEMQPTLAFLASRGLRYDHVLFGLATGERVLINDEKPGGLRTAVAINVPRDVGLGDLSIRVDPGI